MLNLNCVICTEIFASSDEVYTTTCGHMFHHSCLQQWLERSKTCPQCRHRCTAKNCFRIYFNLANLDASLVDIGSLHSQLDNFKLQINERNKEVNTLKEQITSLKNTQQLSIRTIGGLEAKLQQAKFQNQSYIEQIKLIKTEVSLLDEMRKQIKQLKQELAIVESTNNILNSSSGEVDKMLKNQSDVKTLATWVTVLKRQLKSHEFKKSDMRNLLKIVQNDLRRELENKKLAQDRISELESKNYELTEKLKAFEMQPNVSSGSSADMKSLVTSLLNKNVRLNISPSISENVKKIEESDSPYFSLKSSSIGLVPLFKRSADSLSSDNIIPSSTNKVATIKVSPRKNAVNTSSISKSDAGGILRKHHSDLSLQYSIMKKPRIGLSAAATSAKSACLSKPLVGTGAKNFISNRFGGGEKPTLFVDLSNDEQSNNESSKGKHSIAAANVSANGRANNSIEKNTGAIPKPTTSSLLLSRRNGLRHMKISK